MARTVSVGWTSICVLQQMGVALILYSWRSKRLVVRKGHRFECKSCQGPSSEQMHVAKPSPKELQWSSKAATSTLTMASPSASTRESRQSPRIWDLPRCKATVARWSHPPFDLIWAHYFVENREKYSCYCSVGYAGWLWLPEGENRAIQAQASSLWLSTRCQSSLARTEADLVPRNWDDERLDMRRTFTCNPR